MNNGSVVPVWERAQRYFVVSEGCWEWTGALSGGYGRIQTGPSGKRRARPAHRVVYEAMVGPIPAGLTLDHLCRNTRCVNPAHLEPVTIGVNVMRGETIPARKAAQTKCVNGHPFDAENTYRDPRRGNRQCRTCRRKRN